MDAKTIAIIDRIMQNVYKVFEKHSDQDQKTKTTTTSVRRERSECASTVDSKKKK